MRTRALAFFSACLVAAFALAQQPNTLTQAERADGYSLLFNGTSLEGWTTAGNPDAWAVEDGAIITRPGGGRWLRTTRMYRDFHLTLDFMLTPGANSGIGLRGSSTGDPAFTGFEIQILDTHGQEPTDTRCGAVYNAIAPLVMAVNPPGQWNTYHVRLVGDTLDVTLNGQVIHKAEKLDDRGYIHTRDRPNPLRDRLTTGYIALQEHGHVVKFRNIKIKDLSPDPDPGDFEPIFNGRDPNGWFQTGSTTWTVEDGALIGRDGPGHLFTEAQFTDLEMRAFARVNTRGNSGFYFRTVPNARNRDSWPTGYEAQIDQHDPKNYTGCIYDRAWPQAQAGPITRDNAWFDYRVRAVGSRIQTWINGVQMVDAELTNFDKGHIALQGHHPGNEVRWRDIQIRDLSDGQRGARRAADLLAVPAAYVRVRGPIRVFFCTHSAGYRHEVIPEALQIMADLGKKHDWLTIHATNDVTELTPERLKETDVVVFYTTGALPMGEMREGLIDWIHGGGGFVGIHCATDTFSHYAPYVELIGGTFDGHPWNEEVPVIIEDPTSPIVAPFLSSASRDVDFGRPVFRLADEIYQFKSLNSDMHVLLRLSPNTPKAEQNRPYPLAWTRQPQDGRVFYTALGHRPEVWRDSRFIDHLLAGIRWAANQSTSPEAP